MFELPTDDAVLNSLEYHHILWCVLNSFLDCEILLQDHPDGPVAVFVGIDLSIRA